MSAAASGHELFYKIIPPTDADLTDVHLHGRLRQKADIYWSSTRAFEEWHVKKIVGDKVTIAPLKGRHAREVSHRLNKNNVAGVCLQEKYKGLYRKVC